MTAYHDQARESLIPYRQLLWAAACQDLEPFQVEIPRPHFELRPWGRAIALYRTVVLPRERFDLALMSPLAVACNSTELQLISHHKSQLQEGGPTLEAILSATVPLPSEYIAAPPERWSGSTPSRCLTQSSAAGGRPEGVPLRGNPPPTPVAAKTD